MGGQNKVGGRPLAANGAKTRLHSNAIGHIGRPAFTRIFGY
jgi:hypothetical protein